jgi:hypothetical protein
MSHNNLKAIPDKEWTEIEAISKEFQIELNDLVEIIESKTIKTRGHFYSDQEEYFTNKYNKVVYEKIPDEAWSNFLFEIFKWAEGNFSFLYGFERLDYFLGKDDNMQTTENRFGYTDVEINREDFLKKIRTKKIYTGKREHKFKTDMMRICAETKKGFGHANPENVIKLLENNYRVPDEDFQFEELIENKENSRKGELLFLINNELEKSISYGRFCNLISEFNRSNK